MEIVKDNNECSRKLDLREQKCLIRSFIHISYLNKKKILLSGQTFMLSLFMISSNFDEKDQPNFKSVQLVEKAKYFSSIRDLSNLDEIVSCQLLKDLIKLF